MIAEFLAPLDPFVVAEFNIQVDPEAAKVVFEAGLPLTMVPIEVTHTVRGVCVVGWTRGGLGKSMWPIEMETRGPLTWYP